MKQKRKNFFLFFVLLSALFLFQPYSVWAMTPSTNYNYQNREYVIDRYDLKIIVHENNTLDITENITAYFNVEKHGIYRNIPLRNTVVREDGTTTKNRTQISNVQVSEEYTTSRTGDNYQIKIGSFDRLLTKGHDYKISYTYNLGKDPIKGKDEFYFNLIGTEWDTVIGNITFTITMPKEFDASKLGFSSGGYGSFENDNIFYSVSGNTISGSYEGILGQNEALTVRLELPEDYFVGAGLTINYMDYVLFLIPILLFGICFFLWYKYGRDDTVVETVEFYPPEGFNSLEVGFLYKGKAVNKDVTSLMIYLANKGYIKITETEEKSLFTKSKGFKITKIKDYDGTNEEERLFFQGLFENARSKSEEKIEEVRSRDLENHFYRTMNKILRQINQKENKDKIFDKKASKKRVWVVLMIILSYVLITVPSLLTYGEIFLLPFALLFPGIGFSVLFGMTISSIKQMRMEGRFSAACLFEMLFGLVWGGIFGGVPWVVMVFIPLLADLPYLIFYFIGLVCIFGMIFIFLYLPKRTPYGNEILGKLRGFKRFLETAEKEKLEMMVNENPSYFYDILPYTYVLGVSDKWIKKFESISIPPPSWYDSPNAFDILVFETFINNTMASAQSSMSSSPSSSSSGGSSGGGFSGGGSGGGGGGSW